MKDEFLLAEETLDYEQLFAEDLSFNGFDETYEYPISETEEAADAPLINPSCDNVGAERAHVLISTASTATPANLQRKQASRGGVSKKGSKRGSYNCGRCGLPKKGHICTDIEPSNTPVKRDELFSPQCQSQSYSQSQSQSDSAKTGIIDRGGSSRSHPLVNTPSHNTVTLPAFRLARQTSSVCGAKRSLSMHRDGDGKGVPPARFDLKGIGHGNKRVHCRGSSALSFSPSDSSNRPVLDVDMDSVDSMHLPDQGAPSWLSRTCLVEIFKRMPPSSLLAASMVCTQWSQYARHFWCTVTETQLMVTQDQKKYIHIMLQKCPNLVHLTLDARSEIDDNFLRSIAYSTQCLSSFEVQIRHGGVNMITGDGLGHFLAKCKSLYSLKLESCKAIRSLHLCSTHLATLWMADCYMISTMVINCPALTELSLDFSPEDDGSTDLCNMMDILSESCPRLSKLHIASVSLDNSLVLALASSNFRFLSMLSLTFGSGITDESVATLASSWNNLQLLDLSGSSITDKGLGIICSAFSGTLSKLLIALCHRVSIAGLQMVATQLPFLELLDCGMTIEHKSHTSCNDEATVLVRQQLQEREAQHSVQKLNILSKANTISNRLVIKHVRLKKLSLWGCSGIRALYLDCPELVELNLNSCSSLNPENMFLHCPALKTVHSAYCKKVVTCAFQSKVYCSTQNETLHLFTKRMADGSKRIQAPQFDIIQPCEDGEVEESLSEHSQSLTHPI